jgi:pyridoxamine 5'-phosphate oxidase
MSDDRLAARREDYSASGLDRADVADDPFAQFRRWFDEWTALDPYDANAMAVATADAKGRPSVRFVLLKGIDHGFVFFTNTTSHKGRDLAANPQASLCFGWLTVERQVRVTGTVGRVTDAEADEYFATRPRGSQLGAWASDQSEPIADRPALEQRWAAADQRFADGDVLRPPDWGGYRVVPDEIEFWQGRRSRLHDRIAYRRPTADAPWVITRLMP